MYGDFGRGIESLFIAMLVGLALSVPLAIWKVVDIVRWLLANVRIEVQ